MRVKILMAHQRGGQRRVGGQRESCLPVVGYELPRFGVLTKSLCHDLFLGIKVRARGSNSKLRERLKKKIILDNKVVPTT